MKFNQTILPETLNDICPHKKECIIENQSYKHINQYSERVFYSKVYT